MPHRTLTATATVLAVAALTACSSSGGSSSGGPTRQCATFDAGAAILTADWPGLNGNGAFPSHAISDIASAVYNMGQSQNGTTGELNGDFHDADAAVQNLSDALQSGAISGSTNDSDQLAALRQAYATVVTACAAHGYTFKNVLG